MTKLYDTDFYSWALGQADAVRRRSANELDWDNLAEELEGLSRTEARELASRYEVLLVHLLKWIYQPDRRSRSWRNTIALQRRKLRERLEDSPALAAREGEFFAGAYSDARLEASSETDLDLDVFPEQPPFGMDAAKDESWLPE